MAKSKEYWRANPRCDRIHLYERKGTLSESTHAPDGYYGCHFGERMEVTNWIHEEETSGGTHAADMRGRKSSGIGTVTSCMFLIFSRAGTGNHGGRAVSAEGRAGSGTAGVPRAMYPNRRRQCGTARAMRLRTDSFRGTTRDRSLEVLRQCLISRKRASASSADGRFFGSGLVMSSTRWLMKPKLRLLWNDVVRRLRPANKANSPEQSPL
jgi:hypothetical protein